ncbi:Fc.00g080120.m01.CDS01 [Cosmosporella sp. VM-42]
MLGLRSQGVRALCRREIRRPQFLGNLLIARSIRHFPQRLDPPFSYQDSTEQKIKALKTALGRTTPGWDPMTEWVPKIPPPMAQLEQQFALLQFQRHGDIASEYLQLLPWYRRWWEDSREYFGETEELKKKEPKKDNDANKKKKNKEKEPEKTTMAKAAEHGWFNW